MDRDRLRAIGYAVAPGLMADRARRYERTFRLQTGVTAAAEKLVQERGPVVSAGVFRGMTYPAARIPDVDTPVRKLSGSYEAEIASLFQRAVDRGVRTFIDVGCADGYYAVGMPFASPATTSYAFDLASSARELCAEVARLNRVADRVHVAGRFTQRSLAGLDMDDALLLCDIEGAEVELFTPSLVRELRRSAVVIEVHEDARPGAGDALCRTFGSSHTVDVVQQDGAGDGPELSEHRPPLLHWIVAFPR